VNSQRYWFGQSLLWLGVLYSSPECATAETVLPAVSDAVASEAALHLPVTQAEDQRSNRAATMANISPPEMLFSAPQRLDTIDKLAKSNSVSPEQVSHDAIVQLPMVQQQRQAESPSAANQPQKESVPHTIPRSPDLTVPANPEQTVDEVLDSTEPVDSGQETDAAAAIDPELGRLRVRERALTIEADPDAVFLSARVNYFHSDNILLDEFEPIDDQLLRVGLSLLATPNLGSQTQLFASVGGNVARYADLSDLDYQDLEMRAEIQRVLFPRTYGSLGWSNRQFFSADDGDRFLNDHSVRLSLSRRDPLAPQLTLDSFYQLRLSFADPIDRSRLSHTLGAALIYDIQPDLEVELDYQLALTDFTRDEREDAYHQVTARLSYNLSNSSRVILFAGFSFGRSSESNVDFNSSIAGVSFSTFLPLF
jgi:hypothetical protein